MKVRLKDLQLVTEQHVAMPMPAALTIVLHKLPDLSTSRMITITTIISPSRKTRLCDR